MTKTSRTDQLLVIQGLAESRTRAQALIKAGLVSSGGEQITKPSHLLDEDAPLVVAGRDHPWVSRGGIKLATGLAHFGWDVAGATAMDIGASTGGFTDVLLTNGASLVYAVDVGTDQLAPKLRDDARVIALEQTNARHLTASDIPALIDLFVCDASFISLTKVLENPLTFAAPAARLMALIKPQFEVGRGHVGKGGIITDTLEHRRVCDEVRAWLAEQGWCVEGIISSPITGPDGNKEFLIAAHKA